MRARTAEAPESGDRRQQHSYPYDAFLSYDHDDQPVAYGIQRGLHKVGRRLGQLHALRVFRDSTDLTASPDLWGKVTEAMDQSRYLIVVLSPHAVVSKWVDREVAHWLEHRGPDRMLFVVAGGTVAWDEASARFDPDRSDAALPSLTRPGTLPTEPLYVDVSKNAPWDPEAALFREKVTDLAAPIHGKPKYELASEDLREQRKSRLFRRAAFVVLALLTACAVAATVCGKAGRGPSERRSRAPAEQRRGAAPGLRSRRPAGWNQARRRRPRTAEAARCRRARPGDRRRRSFRRRGQTPHHGQGRRCRGARVRCVVSADWSAGGRHDPSRPGTAVARCRDRRIGRRRVDRLPRRRT